MSAVQIPKQILEYLVGREYLIRYFFQILQYLLQILQYLLQILEYLLRLNAPLATRSRRDRAHACLGARRAAAQHEGQCAGRAPTGRTHARRVESFSLRGAITIALMQPGGEWPAGRATFCRQLEARGAQPSGRSARRVERAMAATPADGEVKARTTAAWLCVGGGRAMHATRVHAR